MVAVAPPNLVHVYAKFCTLSFWNSSHNELYARHHSETSRTFSVLWHLHTLTSFFDDIIEVNFTDD